jgi:cell division protein FtsL
MISNENKNLQLVLRFFLNDLNCYTHDTGCAKAKKPQRNEFKNKSIPIIQSVKKTTTRVEKFLHAATVFLLAVFSFFCGCSCSRTYFIDALLRDYNQIAKIVSLQAMIIGQMTC